MHSGALSYRSDIDGLRAVAVTAVVLFHAFERPILPGGFTGVDVFFVISGFLITRIIAGEIEQGSFSFLAFYERRIKRIIPALFLVLLFCMIAGWFLLMPGDYEAMAESALYTIASLSNFYFLDHTGYFDPRAESMPLLHTWSLGVEEQFYLAWPAILAGLYWLSGRAKVSVAYLIAGLGLVGFAYSVWLTGVDSKAAFFLAPARAYELLIGALVAYRCYPRALVGSPLAANGAMLVGVGLVGYGFLGLDARQPFPGALALFPAAGTALLIAGGELRRGPVFGALSLAPVVQLGKISYSLYLWHWPVLVFYAHFAGAPPDARASIALIALSVVIAQLSYTFVEQPARASRLGLRRHYAAFVTSAAGMAALAGAITLSNGALIRLPLEARAYASLETMWAWDCREQRAIEGLGADTCVFGAPWELASHRGIVWGDSHAQHYAPLLDIAGRDLGISFALYRSCPRVVGGDSAGKVRATASEGRRCAEADAAVISWLSNHPGTIVVLAAAWGGLPAILSGQKASGRQSRRGLELLESGLEATLREIDPSRHGIVLLGQVPVAPGRLVACAHRLAAGLISGGCGGERRLGSRAVARSAGPTERLLQRIAEKSRVSFLDTRGRLCGETSCRVTLDGEFLYRDTNHIRRNLKPETMRELAETIGLGHALDAAIKTGRGAAGLPP